MQKRLSSRSSGALEGIGPGGGFNSELKPVTPEIKTEIPSLKLRLLKEEDAEELSLRVDQNREHLWRWETWIDEAKNTSDTLKLIQKSVELATNGTGFRYALLLHGEIVGMVNFNTVEKINRCATMGYWLAKSQTGKGLMTTAAKTLIGEGFQHLELNR